MLDLPTTARGDPIPQDLRGCEPGVSKFDRSWPVTSHVFSRLVLFPEAHARTAASRHPVNMTQRVLAKAGAGEGSDNPLVTAIATTAGADLRPSRFPLRPVPVGAAATVGFFAPHRDRSAEKSVKGQLA
jgi:hypothetical protein